MTNEIPVSLFSIILIADFVLILYTILKITKPPTADMIIASSISTFLSFISANSILNGNVVMVYASSASYTYIPVQSLPLHYLLLMFGIIMAITSVFFVYTFIQKWITSEKSAFGDWLS